MKKNSPTKAQKNSTGSETTTLHETRNLNPDEQLERLMPYSPDASRFTVICRRSDYSAGSIARAIEDCNTHVLNLNLTADVLKDDMVSVDVRVDRKNIASIARSLARFGYVVSGHEETEDIWDETDRKRVAELLRYLEV